MTATMTGVNMVAEAGAAELESGDGARDMGMYSGGLAIAGGEWWMGCGDITSTINLWPFLQWTGSPLVK